MKYKVLNAIILIGLLGIMACGADSSKTKKEVLKDLLQFDEIKSSDLYIRNLTNNKQGISLMGGGGNNSDDMKYFKLGFNGEDRFETYYTIRYNQQKEFYEIEDLENNTWKILK